MTGRAATLPFVRMDREATRTVPINRRALTALLVQRRATDRRSRLKRRASVRVASARDAADAGVDGAGAMGARTPATPPSSNGSLRRWQHQRPAGVRTAGRTRLRTPISSSAMPLPSRGGGSL